MLEDRSLEPRKYHCKTLNFRMASSHKFSLLLQDGKKQPEGSEAKMRSDLTLKLTSGISKVVSKEVRLDLRKLQLHSQHHSMGDGSCLLVLSNYQVLVLQLSVLT